MLAYIAIKLKEWRQQNPPKAHLAKGDDFIIVIVFEISMVREGEEFIFLYNCWSTASLSKEIRLTFEKILILSNICHVYRIRYYLNYVFVLSKILIKMSFRE